MRAVYDLFCGDVGGCALCLTCFVEMSGGVRAVSDLFCGDVGGGCALCLTCFVEMSGGGCALCLTCFVEMSGGGVRAVSDLFLSRSTSGRTSRFSAEERTSACRRNNQCPGLRTASLWLLHRNLYSGLSRRSRSCDGLEARRSLSGVFR